MLGSLSYIMCCAEWLTPAVSGRVVRARDWLFWFLVILGFAGGLLTVETRADPGDDNPALFHAGDIKESDRFISILSSNQADAVSQYLWGTFSTKDRKALLDGGKAAEEKLVEVLNNTIKGRSPICNDSHFVGVDFATETKKLIEYDPIGWDLVWLNRLVLRDAYAAIYVVEPISFQPFQPPSVWHVRTQRDLPVHPSYPYTAQRNDRIWVDAYGVDRWIDDLKNSKKLADKESPRTMVPYLNHIALLGVHPFEVFKYADVKDNVGLTSLGFCLTYNQQTKGAWMQLLNQPVFNRNVSVTLGFENGEEMDSYVVGDDSKDKESQFFLTVIPHRIALGATIIIAALFAFLWLARHTHIVRDTSAPGRPDGLKPYSLARAQMAFWFFLVIAAYFFIWIVTGDMDTLNSSVLGLIGISAGTALGSAFVDASKPVSAGAPGNVPIVDVTKPHLEVVEELSKLRQDTQKELETLQKARAQISANDKQLLDANERDQDTLRGRLLSYRWQTAYFAWPQWKGVMYDLLAENNLISFHRFQIFVWTLVLGLMFVVNVYSDLAMPQFSATLLGLMGISAGTFIGFKLPETKGA